MCERWIERERERDDVDDDMIAEGGDFKCLCSYAMEDRNLYYHRLIIGKRGQRKACWVKNVIN